MHAATKKGTRNHWFRVPVSIRSRVEGQEWRARDIGHRLLAYRPGRSLGPTRVQPARPCGHKALNLARLPIPPRARSCEPRTYKFTRLPLAIPARLFLQSPASKGADQCQDSEHDS